MPASNSPVAVSSWSITRIMHEAMATTGDWDLVCCGHDHVPEISTVINIKDGVSYVVNPGTVGGVDVPAATYVLGNLEAMTFEVREVREMVRGEG